MARIGLIAAAVLLLAGCGVSPGADADPGAASPASARASSAPVASTTAPAHAGSDTGAEATVDAAAPGFPPTRSRVVVHQRQFTSPTGNIACQVRRSGAACVITEHDYPATDRPDDCAGHWLPRLEVDIRHRAALGTCEGGVLEAGQALPYGTTTVVGPMSCLSLQSGMVCWSGRSGHGFSVARAAFGLH